MTQVALINDSSELATRMVKAQLEKTLLGTLCLSMSLVMRPGSAFVDIVLDLPLIEQLQLRIDPISVRRAIVAQRKLKLAFDQVRCGTTVNSRPPYVASWLLQLSTVSLTDVLSSVHSPKPIQDRFSPCWTLALRIGSR